MQPQGAALSISVQGVEFARQVLLAERLPKCGVEMPKLAEPLSVPTVIK